MPAHTPAAAEDLFPELLAGVASPRASVRFRSAKTLALLAGETPEAAYPHFDSFLKLLDSENSIVRWNAMRMLAALAPADREGKLEAVLPKYLSAIAGPQMIGAATAMQGAAAIALAQPHLAERLAQAILGVRRARYETDECKNVAMGHAIKALDRFFDLIDDQATVLRFVRGQLDNSRPATQAKARDFLKRRGEAGSGKRAARRASARSKA